MKKLLATLNVLLLTGLFTNAALADIQPLDYEILSADEDERTIEVDLDIELESDYNYSIDCSNLVKTGEENDGLIEFEVYADDEYTNCTFSIWMEGDGAVTYQTEIFDFAFSDYVQEQVIESLGYEIEANVEERTIDVEFPGMSLDDEAYYYSWDCSNLVKSGTVRGDEVRFEMYSDNEYTNCTFSISMREGGAVVYQTEIFDFNLNDYSDDNESDDEGEEEHDESDDDHEDDDHEDDDGIELPPAGYEDEVITNFTGYRNPFPDTGTTDLEGRAAAELYRRAVIGGFPDGEFKGDETVNRAQLAKFFLLARFESVDDADEDGGFPDVRIGEWYTKFVVRAAERGIISGYPNGLFLPADTVNTAEFLKMLSKTFQLEEDLAYSYSDVDSEDWFARYAGVAEAYGLFPERENELMPAEELSRKEVAIAIYQYLINS